MAQRDELLAALEAVLGDAPGLATIHSSMAMLAPPMPLGQWDALYAVGRLVQRGWTLAFPAFTFSFCRGGVYDREATASETGVLADWVRAGLPGAIRTDHPIYSFVVIGPKAAEIAACPSETTFGDTSPFALFEAEDAHVVMLGSGWNYATPFHRYEEKAGVPYRLFKTFEGTIRRAGEAAPGAATMYVRDLDIAAKNDFTPLVAHMRAAGWIASAPLWRAQAEAARMSAIRTSAEALLGADPLAFVGNSAEVRYRIDLAEEAARLAPFRIALLGSSNLDIAGHDLHDRLGKLMPGRKVALYVAPFGQMAQQIMFAGSDLAEFRAELAIFADRLEDLLGVPALDLADPDTLVDAVQQYTGLIRRFAEDSGATVVVHRFALTQRHTVERMAELSGLVAACNRILDETLADLPRIAWVDLAGEAARGAPVGDARLWHLGRIPFSKPFTARLVERWSGIVLAMLGKTARLLVLDLDNTLWGGVLGEDGPEGIAIGGDSPGNAFARFQTTIKTLAERGFALAVCSKNDEALALDVLTNHKDMSIRPDDLATHRINWMPKWQNIREIAAELDLGLGSVMFIDDNPVEREAIKRNLPMVAVLELPTDPTAYADALLDSPFVETLRTGQEDRKRVASYKARAAINLERSAAASIEDFLRGLKMQLHVHPLDDRNIARAAQLCQKTNQFNTTTRRYSPRDLQELAATGVDVAVIGLEDKFTGSEIIGLILLRPGQGESAGGGEVDLFLLSCRVLGRTVERAVLDWAVTRAYKRGWAHLTGEIVETPRNTPVLGVFADNGFGPTGIAGRWRRATAPSPLPDWFVLHDGFK